MKLDPFDVLDLTGDDPIVQRAMGHLQALLAKYAAKERGEHVTVPRQRIATRPRG